MSRLAIKSVVYHGDLRLGELDAIPANGHSFRFPNNEIRIHRISPISERCPPLSILQTVSSFSVRCKLESSSPVEQANLINLHASCFYEFKTAVVLLGEEEIHLVAMPSKQKKFPCFWCFSVPLGLYESSLRLLNLRCLSIVFDLDETLIVANTMKSFEDRIEALRGWIARETDSVRISGMSAELKRYVDDRALLKQYADGDCVMDNGKMYKVQLEEVPQLSDSHEKVVRPVIRLQERNTVLTRINPEIRDTSVLVRLRPAWDELRSYLTAKGRKRFEVYVCTMAERDYALEMWRLLDPEAHLINSKQLWNRIVCVKSGSRKSLLNVFQDGNCHPKMAMVIDDRSKVWEDRDQPRVHVVPPFAPYYAPQAETANAVPVLCVARNVACNVRGYFFKEFDENLLRKISEVFYEDEVVTLPHAPDVSSYLMSEDTGSVPNGPNGAANAPFADGMHGAEIEKRLNPLGEKHAIDVAGIPVKETPDVKSETSQPTITIIPNIVGPNALRTLMPSQKPGLLGNPARQDFSFSDREHDVKRRILTMTHGPDLKNQGLSEPLLLSRPPVQLPTANIQPHRGLPVEEDSGKGHINCKSSGFSQESDSLKFDKQRAHQIQLGHNLPSVSTSGVLSDASQVKAEEVWSCPDQKKTKPSTGSQQPEIGVPQNQSCSNDTDIHADAVKENLLQLSLSIAVLQEIGRRCSSKVEFRSILSTSKDLQFSVEVLFTGEKIGVGMGKTRKDAQQQAALNALHSLAEKYVTYASSHSQEVDKNVNKISQGKENGFLWDVVSPGSHEPPRENEFAKGGDAEAQSS